MVGHLLYRLHNQTQKRLVLWLDQGQLTSRSALELLLLRLGLDLNHQNQWLDQQNRQKKQPHNRQNQQNDLLDRLLLVDILSGSTAAAGSTTASYKASYTESNSESTDQVVLGSDSFSCSWGMICPTVLTPSALLLYLLLRKTQCFGWRNGAKECGCVITAGSERKGGIRVYEVDILLDVHL